MRLINKVKGKVKDLTSGSDLLQERPHNTEYDNSRAYESIEKEKLIDNITRKLALLDNKSLQKHVDALSHDDYKSFYSDVFFQMEKINYLEQQKSKEESRLSWEASRPKDKSSNNEGETTDGMTEKNDSGIEELQSMRERCVVLEKEMDQQLGVARDLEEKLRVVQEALMQEKADREDDNRAASRKVDASFNMLKEYEVRNTHVEKENTNLKENNDKLKSLLEKRQIENLNLTEKSKIANKRFKDLKISVKRSNLISQTVK